MGAYFEGDIRVEGTTANLLEPSEQSLPVAQSLLYRWVRCGAPEVFVSEEVVGCGHDVFDFRACLRFEEREMRDEDLWVGNLFDVLIQSGERRPRVRRRPKNRASLQFVDGREREFIVGKIGFPHGKILDTEFLTCKRIAKFFTRFWDV